MKVCGLWRLNCNLPGQSRWCVMSTYMTSPSSMLVPDHCVCKGQHSTFDDSWTRSYLPGAWEKFAGNVTISIINLSHMCAYPASLRLKIINNKCIEAIELSKIPRDIWARLALSEIAQISDRVMLVTNQWILPRILGMSDIYRWMVGPLWKHIIYFFLGRGLEITGKTLFFLIFFNFPQSTLFKDVCILLLMKPAFYFWIYFSIQTTSLAFPKFIR